jgi:hypothetical protein
MSRKNKEKPDKKICLKCLKPKDPERDFYKSYSKWHGDGRLPYCKSCLKENLNENDINSVREIMRVIDRPYFHEAWEKAKESKDDTLGKYLKDIALNYKYYNYDQSVFIDDNKQNKKILNQDENESSNLLDDFVVTKEIIEKWGSSGYTKEDYMKLEKFYEDMKRSYEVETASHIDYLKKICKVSLKMEKAIDEGNIDHFKKLSDAYDKLMHSAKFTAVQRSAADRTGGLNTFSEFFELIEREGFIPRFHTDEPNDIVDLTINNLKEYTRNLVLGDPNISKMLDEAMKRQDEKENYEINDEEDLGDYDA